MEGTASCEVPLPASVSGYERNGEISEEISRTMVSSVPLCIVEHKASIPICFYMSLHTIAHEWVRGGGGCRRVNLASRISPGCSSLTRTWPGCWTTTTGGAAGFRVGVFVSTYPRKRESDATPPPRGGMRRPDLGVPPRTDVDVVPAPGCQDSRHPIQAGR